MSAATRQQSTPWLSVVGIGDDGLASLAPGGARAGRRAPRCWSAARAISRWCRTIPARAARLARAARGDARRPRGAARPAGRGAGERRSDVLRRRRAARAPLRRRRRCASCRRRRRLQPGLRPARLVARRGRGAEPARPAARRAAPPPRAGRAPGRAEPRRRDARTRSRRCSASAASGRAGCGCFEHLGGAAERRIEGDAPRPGGRRAVAALNTVAIACVAGPRRRDPRARARACRTRPSSSTAC